MQVAHSVTKGNKRQGFTSDKVILPAIANCLRVIVPGPGEKINVYNSPLPTGAAAMAANPTRSVIDNVAASQSVVGDDIPIINKYTGSDSAVNVLLKRQNSAKNLGRDQLLETSDIKIHHSISGIGCTTKFILDMPKIGSVDGFYLFKYLYPLIINGTNHIRFEQVRAQGIASQYIIQSDIVRSQNINGESAILNYRAELFAPKNDNFECALTTIRWGNIVYVAKIDPSIIEAYTNSSGLIDVRKVLGQLSVFFTLRANSILRGVDQIFANQNISCAIGFFTKAWFLILQDQRDAINNRALPANMGLNNVVIYNFNPPAQGQPDNRDVLIGQLLRAGAAGELVLEWGAQVGPGNLIFIILLSMQGRIVRPPAAADQPNLNRYASDYINWAAIPIHVVVRVDSVALPVIPIVAPAHFNLQMAINLLRQVGNLYGIANDILPALEIATELYWSTFLGRYNQSSLNPNANVDPYHELRPTEDNPGFDYVNHRCNFIPGNADRGAYLAAYRSRFIDAMGDIIANHHNGNIPQNWDPNAILATMNVPARDVQPRAVAPPANVPRISEANAQRLEQFQRAMRFWIQCTAPAPPVRVPLVQSYRVCSATNQIVLDSMLPAPNFMSWVFVLPKNQHSMPINVQDKDSMALITTLTNQQLLLITATGSLFMSSAVTTFHATYSLTGRDVARSLQRLNIDKIFISKILDLFFRPYQLFVLTNPVYRYVRAFLYYTTGVLLSSDNTTFRAWGLEPLQFTALLEGDWYYLGPNEEARPYMKFEPQVLFPLMLVRPLDWCCFTRNPLLNTHFEVRANADENRTGMSWLSQIGCSKFYEDASKTTSSLLCRNIPYGFGVISALTCYNSYTDNLPILTATQWPVFAAQLSNPVPHPAPPSWRIRNQHLNEGVLRSFHFMPYDHDNDVIRFVSLTRNRNEDTVFDPAQLASHNNFEVVGAGLSSAMSDRTLYTDSSLSTWNDDFAHDHYLTTPVLQTTE